MYKFVCLVLEVYVSFIEISKCCVLRMEVSVASYVHGIHYDLYVYVQVCLF